MFEDSPKMGTKSLINKLNTLKIVFLSTLCVVFILIVTDSLDVLLSKIKHDFFLQWT